MIAFVANNWLGSVVTIFTFLCRDVLLRLVRFFGHDGQMNGEMVLLHVHTSDMSCD